MAPVVGVEQRHGGGEGGCALSHNEYSALPASALVVFWMGSVPDWGPISVFVPDSSFRHGLEQVGLGHDRVSPIERLGLVAGQYKVGVLAFPASAFGITGCRGGPWQASLVFRHPRLDCILPYRRWAEGWRLNLMIEGRVGRS